MTTEETITITRSELALALADHKFFPGCPEGSKVRLRYPYAAAYHIFRAVSKARAEADVLDLELPVSEACRPGSPLSWAKDQIGPQTGREVPTHPDGTGFEVEVVETYEKDAVYQDARGVMFLHKDPADPYWIRLPDLHAAAWNNPVRPLTKLGAVPS